MAAFAGSRRSLELHPRSGNGWGCPKWPSAGRWPAAKSASACSCSPAPPAACRSHRPASCCCRIANGSSPRRAAVPAGGAGHGPHQPAYSRRTVRTAGCSWPRSSRASSPASRTSRCRWASPTRRAGGTCSSATASRRPRPARRRSPRLHLGKPLVLLCVAAALCEGERAAEVAERPHQLAAAGRGWPTSGPPCACTEAPRVRARPSTFAASRGWRSTTLRSCTRPRWRDSASACCPSSCAGRGWRPASWCASCRNGASKDFSTSTPCLHCDIRRIGGQRVHPVPRSKPRPSAGLVQSGPMYVVPQREMRFVLDELIGAQALTAVAPGLFVRAAGLRAHRRRAVAEGVLEL